MEELSTEGSMENSLEAGSPEVSESKADFQRFPPLEASSKGRKHRNPHRTRGALGVRESNAVFNLSPLL